MGTVLYECSWTYDRHAMIPLMLVAAAVVMFRKKKPEGMERVFLLFFAAVSILVSLLTVAEQIDQYNKIVLAYRRGDYQITEGYVENFHPMPAEGHDSEHFEVDGIFFEYSDSTVQQGYHNARSRGGVITGDGQHLRIGYIEMDSATGNGMLENVIVYIEQLP